MTGFINYIRAIIAITAGVMLWPGGPAVADHFKVYGNILPPYGYEQNDRLEGFSVDLVKALLRQSGHKLHENKVHLLPFARILHNLEFQHDVIGLHIARSPDREARFHWVGPYYTISMGLIGKKQRSITGNSLQDFNPYTIGVVRQTLPHRLLLDGEVPDSSINLSPEPGSALRMLSSGRIDLFAHIFDSSKWILKREGMDTRLYEEKFSMKTADFYFAFSRAQDKDEINRFNAILANLKADPVYQDLCAKHNLTRC